MSIKTIVVSASVIALVACGGTSDIDAPAETTDTVTSETILTMLIDAKEGDVIEIPAGTYAFDRGLSLAVDNVTIRGAGMDKTVLSFADQVAGAEGLLVTASNFTIEDIAIEDAKGDALKINEGDTITIRNVRTEWTGGPDTNNGAYGIYPVQTTNVLIEGSVAIGASDAGIYVGQSQDIIVRNNRAEYNVAGIEVENSIRADVYDNVAINNTGGILVFNLAGLTQEGRETRIFQNEVRDNNVDNFAPAGTIVASVPSGTGIIINANDAVEIFDNQISNNKTANIIVSSLFSSGYSEEDATEQAFDPYVETIYIYDNEFAGGGDAPSTAELAALKLGVFGEDGRMTDVLWDGFVDLAKQVDGQIPDALKICVDNGDALVLNADAPNGYAGPSLYEDANSCTHEKLPPVDLNRG